MRQQFHEQNVRSLDVILVEEEAISLQDPPSIYLSVVGDESNPGVTVYEWDFDEDEVRIEKMFFVTEDSFNILVTKSFYKLKTVLISMLSFYSSTSRPICPRLHPLVPYGSTMVIRCTYFYRKKRLKYIEIPQELTFTMSLLKSTLLNRDLFWIILSTLKEFGRLKNLFLKVIYESYQTRYFEMLSGSY